MINQDGSMQMDEEGHADGDGCAIYFAGYQVWRRRTEDEDEHTEVDVEDLAVGDHYRDAAFEAEEQWLDVEEVEIVNGDEVHILANYVDKIDDDVMAA